MNTQVSTLLRSTFAVIASLLLALPLTASDQYKETVVQPEHQMPNAVSTEDASPRLFPTLMDAAFNHQAPAAAAAPAPAMQRRSNILGALSLSFGLSSFLFLFIPFLGYVSLPFALAAIVLGAIGIAADDRAGMSVAGMVLGILVLLLFILLIILVASFL